MAGQKWRARALQQAPEVPGDSAGGVDTLDVAAAQLLDVELSDAATDLALAEGNSGMLTPGQATQLFDAYLSLFTERGIELQQLECGLPGGGDATGSNNHIM